MSADRSIPVTRLLRQVVRQGEAGADADLQDVLAGQRVDRGDGTAAAGADTPPNSVSYTDAQRR